MSDAINPIGNIFLFRNLPYQEQEKINSLCDWKNVAAGQEILHEDDKTTDVFFVAEGGVSAKSFSPHGKEVTFIDIEAGDLFGEFSAIDGELRSATVTTTTQSLIGRITARQFKSILNSYPEFGFEFAAHLVGKIRKLSNRVYEFTALNVRCRLHLELLRMCDKNTQTNTAIIDPAPTHYELATHISTHREAVSREISRLVSLGILETSGRTYTISDYQRLEALVEVSGVQVLPKGRD